MKKHVLLWNDDKADVKIMCMVAVGLLGWTLYHQFIWRAGVVKALGSFNSSSYW